VFRATDLFSVVVTQYQSHIRLLVHLERTTCTSITANATVITGCKKHPLLSTHLLQDRVFAQLAFHLLWTQQIHTENEV
jgi:hypothetical protein